MLWLLKLAVNFIIIGASYITPKYAFGIIKSEIEVERTLLLVSGIIIKLYVI